MAPGILSTSLKIFFKEMTTCIKLSFAFYNVKKVRRQFKESVMIYLHWFEYNQSFLFTANRPGTEIGSLTYIIVH
jgi:hypothetical protein